MNGFVNMKLKNLLEFFRREYIIFNGYIIIV